MPILRKLWDYVADNMNTESSVKALNMAIKQRKNEIPLIHHSDRGLQYCANDYQNTLNKKRNIAKYDAKL
jgi:transposase InsO family protein